jgi:UDP-hydrolysing UDP-N-acetyl-D-glucosamine 2-epimerase
LRGLHAGARNMSAPRRICVVTGSRAEYGLLRPLIFELVASPRYELQLAVTGTHLSARHGRTIDEIHADRIPVVFEAPIVEAPDDSRLSVTRAMASALAQFGDGFARLRPDLVIVLGDRYEIFAVAQAAFMAGVPIGHLHGGEVTEGAWDDAIRHAITKLSHIHFCAADAYARRIMQMGEEARHVHVVGAIAVDIARTLAQEMTRDEIDRDLGLALREPSLLVTYHPVTLRSGDEGESVAALLAALDSISGARIVFTGANADSGGDAIMARVRDYAERRRERVTLHTSLGQRRYLNVMRHSAVVVGNSSSGIVEAPALEIPTVNIGDRQRGRLKAQSVIDCGETEREISEALARALSPEFRSAIVGQALPYQGGSVARKVIEILDATDFSALRVKTFHDWR